MYLCLHKLKMLFLTKIIVLYFLFTFIASCNNNSLENFIHIFYVFFYNYFNRNEYK